MTGPEVDVQTCAHVQCPGLIFVKRYSLAIGTKISNFMVVDGNWGQWTTWSECSEACETGRRFRNRLCNNPAPDFGGKPCNDPSTALEEELCNTHNCPGMYEYIDDVHYSFQIVDGCVGNMQ